MIIGIGVDTVNIERFERIVTETPAFVRRVFTPTERTRNLRSQAVRFAAKEAVAKVLGAPDGLNWQHCEVASTDTGQPYLILAGTIAARARSLGINRIHLSLAHDDPVAVAVATAEYLNTSELEHLRRFNPESYRITVLEPDETPNTSQTPGTN